MTEKYRHWCLTLNNYNDNDVTELRLFATKTKYLVFGKEVGDGGTRHLQGFISFSSPRKIGGLLKLFGGRAHWEVARSPAAAAQYCKKDGDFEEFGTRPEESRKGQGKRSDIEEVRDRINAGERDPKRLRQEFPGVCAKYPRFVSQLLIDQISAPPVPCYPLRGWQQELFELLKTNPNDREIIFIVDFEGNGGKTWFIKYYRQLTEKSINILPGKKADMCYAFIQLVDSLTRVVFIDAPRSKQGEFIQYDFLEDLKNGSIFNTKYESQMINFPVPHVVVMMNEEPDMKKLSADRYNIIHIN